MSGVSSHEILNTMCVFHTAGSQSKPSNLQLPQDLSGPQSHLDQLSEMFLGNPQPILTSLENKVKDFSAPGLSLCSLWKASPSWKEWVPRALNTDLVIPQCFAPCCWLCLCLLYLTSWFYKSEPEVQLAQD